MSLLVQRATPHTVGEVAALFNDYRVFYEQASDVKLALEFISERVINNESVIFYAKDPAGKVLGFTQLYPSFSSVSVKRIWVLNDLFVSPSARGCGVARQLMYAAQDFAMSTGAKGINLETTAENLNAQALYESLGYEKISGFFVSA